jgi:molybdopterin molybdotransferase
MKSMSLGLAQALSLTMESIEPLPAESLALVDSIGRVAASDLHALVDSPPMNSSRKDGYAVLGRDIAEASAENPVRLRVVGTMVAGGQEEIEVKPGTTVRVLTGARIPAGADTVVAEEYADKDGDSVIIDSYIDHRLNILKRGGDVALGQEILKAGRKISPVIGGPENISGHGRAFGRGGA